MVSYEGLSGAGGAGQSETQQRPQVDIVVVAYNGAEHLRELLPQLCAQQGIETHVVVVDNASQDSSADVAEELGAEVVRSPTNDGYGTACNRGLERGSAPWVVVANQDLSVPEGAIAALIERAVDWEQATGCPVIVGPALRRRDGTLAETSHRLPTFGRLVYALLAGDHRAGIRDAGSAGLEHAAGWISAVMLVARRSTLSRLGGFDPAYFMYVEDVDLLYRHRQQGGLCVISPAATVTHGGGSSAHSPLMHAHALLNWQRFARSHWGRTRGAAVMGAAIVGSFGRSLYWLAHSVRPPDQGEARSLARMFAVGGGTALRWYLASGQK